MNIPAILETARRIREGDLPFDFNMRGCATCIMGVIGRRHQDRPIGAFNVADAFNISRSKASELCYPTIKFENLKEIPAWRAADTLERLAATGRVEWDWSEPKMALVIVTPARGSIHE